MLFGEMKTLSPRWSYHILREALSVVILGWHDQALIWAANNDGGLQYMFFADIILTLLCKTF